MDGHYNASLLHETSYILYQNQIIKNIACCYLQSMTKPYLATNPSGSLASRSAWPGMPLYLDTHTWPKDINKANFKTATHGWNSVIVF